MASCEDSATHRTGFRVSQSSLIQTRSLSFRSLRAMSFFSATSSAFFYGCYEVLHHRGGSFGELKQIFVVVLIRSCRGRAHPIVIGEDCSIRTGGSPISSMITRIASLLVVITAVNRDHCFLGRRPLSIGCRGISPLVQVARISEHGKTQRGAQHSGGGRRQLPREIWHLRTIAR